MKNKRIPCPYCAEDILPQAKKCRYCGEVLTKDEKKSISMRFLYWIWVGSMILFLLSLHFLMRASVNYNGWMIVTTVITLSGLVFFLLLVVKILRSMRKKKVQLYGLATLVSFILFFVVLSQYEQIEAALGFPPPEVDRSLNIPSQTDNILPTTQPETAPVKNSTNTAPVNNSNQINCTGPDGKTFKTTKEKCDSFNSAWGNDPTPNPNEIIQCNIHPNCGGGYKEMTRSSCEQMTCCKLDLNSAPIFTSKSECSNRRTQDCVNMVSQNYSNQLNMCSQYSGDIYKECMDGAQESYDNLIQSCY